MSALLILGGTAEARELAGALHDRGVPVVSSLAGRVAAPRLPPGEVRIGGFGGAEGLERWLVEHDVFAVVDATHPFAARMSASAAEACERAGVPLLRLERPGWRERPGDRWHWVEDVAAAAGSLKGSASVACSPSVGRRWRPSRGSSRRGSSSAASGRLTRRCLRDTSCCWTAGRSR